MEVLNVLDIEIMTTCAGVSAMAYAIPFFLSYAVKFVFKLVE